MTVINRQQTEEITIKRNVSHTLELNGKRYVRIESIKVYVPNMGCEVRTDKPTIKWFEYVKPNVVDELKNKDVIKLGLIELFSKIDINSLNGNNF